MDEMDEVVEGNEVVLINTLNHHLFYAVVINTLNHHLFYVVVINTLNHHLFFTTFFLIIQQFFI